MNEPSQARHAVLDTNVVLDLFLFGDPRFDALRADLLNGHVTWHATAHMRSELQRVLAYPHIAAKLAFYAKTSDQILTEFDRHTQLHPPTAKSPYTCKDPDDQVFIDLACQLSTEFPQSLPVLLCSKDKAVTSMRKRLTKLSVDVICQSDKMTK